MLSQQAIWTVASLAAVDLLFRGAVALYYSDHDRVLRILKLEERQGSLEQYYKKYDAWLAPLPFVWTWVEVVALVIAAKSLGHVWGWLIAIVLIGGRFRALQEFGHNAVHFALCRSHRWQWLLSNMFYQFPMFKRDMHSRQITHTKEHHRHPNHEMLDPNRARVRAGGMVAPLTSAQFFIRLLYPLTLRGMANNVQMMTQATLMNRSRGIALLRVACLLLVSALFYAIGGWQAIVLGWWVPLLSSYPLFVWLALLGEHRWFVEGRPSGSRIDLECWAGRPTDYNGISGWLVRILVSPTSDAYHLAHSLYPGVRWNHLPAIDRVLKVSDARYTAHASQGLIFARSHAPSALSELRERLCPDAAKLGKHHGATISES
jgi:fatty acid desaturase